MSGQFALQVTPELMQRILEETENKPPRRKHARQKRVSVSPISLPNQENRLAKHEPGVQQAPSAEGWLTRDAYYPPFVRQQPPITVFGGLPIVETTVDSAAKSAIDLKKELAPVYEAIEESEKIAQKLKEQRDHDLEKVQEMAQDLQEKQYRAPSYAPPCTNERDSCTQCYRQNHKNPLLCSKLVQAFVACSRQAQEKFAASVSS